MQRSLIMTGALLAVNLAAVHFDIRNYKIPNRLILAGGLTGILLRAATTGASALPEAFGGMMLPVLLLWPLLLFSMIGAGDIKLLMVTGVFLGPAQTARAMAAALALAGAWAVIRMTRKRLWKQRFQVAASYLAGLTMNGAAPYMALSEIHQKRSWMLPLSAAVCAGDLAVCLLWHAG